MRKFFLEKPTGERLSLQDNQHLRFFYEPSGLGYAENLAFAEVEYGFFTETAHEFAQPNINGTMVFFSVNQNPYISYQQFVNWINSTTGLQLVYQPYPTRELYMDIEVTTFDLSERNLTGELLCPIVFAGMSPYHSKNPISFIFDSEEITNPMRFPFSFPFVFSDSGVADEKIFNVQGHFPAALELEINGPCSDVIFSVTEANTGVEIGTLDLSDVSLATGESIYYSSQPNNDGIWKTDSSGEKTDITQLLNIQHSNFFTLPINTRVKATLTATINAEDHIRNTLKVHEYFKG